MIAPLPLWKRPLVAALRAANHLESARRARRLRPDLRPAPDLGPVRRLQLWAPHMDDEVIGGAGLIRRCASAGAETACLYFTDGTYGVPADARADVAAIRRKETAAAAALLGLHRTEFLDQPDGGLRVTPALADELVRRLERTRPDRLLLPYPLDPHPDHRRVFELLLAALERRPVFDGEIYFYQIQAPMAAEDLTAALDITPELDLKRRALAVYGSQGKVPFDVILHLQACQRYLLAGRGRAAEVFARFDPARAALWRERLAAAHPPQVHTFREVGRRAVWSRSWI